MLKIQGIQNCLTNKEKNPNLATTVNIMGNKIFKSLSMSPHRRTHTIFMIGIIPLIGNLIFFTQ